MLNLDKRSTKLHIDIEIENADNEIGFLIYPSEDVSGVAGNDWKVINATETPPTAFNTTDVLAGNAGVSSVAEDANRMGVLVKSLFIAIIIAMLLGSILGMIAYISKRRSASDVARGVGRRRPTSLFLSPPPPYEECVHTVDDSRRRLLTSTTPTHSNTRSSDIEPPRIPSAHISPNVSGIWLQVPCNSRQSSLSRSVPSLAIPRILISGNGVDTAGSLSSLPTSGNLGGDSRHLAARSQAPSLTSSFGSSHSSCSCSCSDCSCRVHHV